MRNTDSELLKILLATFDRAMLVSRKGDILRSRPMTLVQTPESNQIWLLCATVGESFEELGVDSHVNVVLHDGLRFCSVSGTARIARPARDSAVGTAAVASRPSLTRLVLIEVTPQVAEYWERASAPGVRFDDGLGDVPTAVERRVVGEPLPGASAAQPPADEPLEADPFQNVIFVGSTRWRR